MKLTELGLLLSLVIEIQYRGLIHIKLLNLLHIHIKLLNIRVKFFSIFRHPIIVDNWHHMLPQILSLRVRRTISNLAWMFTIIWCSWCTAS